MRETGKEKGSRWNVTWNKTNCLVCLCSPVFSAFNKRRETQKLKKKISMIPKHFRKVSVQQFAVDGLILLSKKPSPATPQQNNSSNNENKTQRRIIKRTKVIPIPRTPAPQLPSCLHHCTQKSSDPSRT